MPSSKELYAEAEKLREEGKLDEAAAKLDALIAGDESYTLAHHALAVIHTRLGKSDLAIKHALRACELEPDDPFSFTALSVAYQRAGKIPEAEDAMARAHILQQGG